MAGYSIIQQADTVEYDIMEVCCDSRDDVQQLPTHWKAGSTCIVLADSSVWMLGNDSVWHELP